MRTNVTVLLGMLLLLAGCASTGPAPRLTSDAYQHHKTFGGKLEDFQVHWNLLRREGEAIAEGYLDTSTGQSNLIVLVREMHLVGVDGEGRVVNRSEGFLPDMFILRAGYGDQGSFRIALPLKGSEAAFDIAVAYDWRFFREKGRKDRH